MGEAFMASSATIGSRVTRNFFVLVRRESIPQITWVAEEKALTLKCVVP
jgi:hypothetical protein